MKDKILEISCLSHPIHFDWWTKTVKSAYLWNDGISLSILKELMVN